MHQYQATFFGYVLRREKLENLATTRIFERKRSRGKSGKKDVGMAIKEDKCI